MADPIDIKCMLMQCNLQWIALFGHALGQELRGNPNGNKYSLKLKFANSEEFVGY